MTRFWNHTANSTLTQCWDSIGTAGPTFTQKGYPFQACWISHCILHPLQSANWCHNSRLVVMKMIWSGWQMKNVHKNILSFCNPFVHSSHTAPLHMKRCICHFVKWQIHPFLSNGGDYIKWCFDASWGLEVLIRYLCYPFERLILY